jgi:beta-aspartyl-dipeptidase (metallo-type)
VDVTAFPVAVVEVAWSADVEVFRYLGARLDPSRITVSSDAGGSLPVFDAEGRVTGTEVGSPGAVGEALRTLVQRGERLERVLPAFTANPARLLRLDRKGRLVPGADADLVVLDTDAAVADVMARGRWHVRDGRAVVRGVFET